MVIILTATYNGEKFIRTQLQSLVAQNYPDTYISVLDDNSNDGTYDILTADLSGSEKAKSVTKNAENVGVPGINFFNLLKKHINDYEYFAFSDQDDVWEPEKISIAIEKLKETNSEFYCSELNIWNGSNDETVLSNKKGRIQLHDHLFESASAGCTCVITKKLANQIIKIIDDKEFSYWKSFSHDWFIYFVTRINKFNYYFDSNSYMKYRVHSNNSFGLLSILSPKSVFFRIKLLRGGWYRTHLSNMIKFIPDNSVEYEIVNTILTGGFLNRTLIVIKHGAQFRRHLLQRVGLQALILFNIY